MRWWEHGSQGLGVWFKEETRRWWGRDDEELVHECLSRSSNVMNPEDSWDAVEGQEHIQGRTKNEERNVNGREEVWGEEEKRRILKGVSESA